MMADVEYCPCCGNMLPPGMHITVTPTSSGYNATVIEGDDRGAAYGKTKHDAVRLATRRKELAYRLRLSSMEEHPECNACRDNMHLYGHPPKEPPREHPDLIAKRRSKGPLLFALHRSALRRSLQRRYDDIVNEAGENRDDALRLEGFAQGLLAAIAVFDEADPNG